MARIVRGEIENFFLPIQNGVQNFKILPGNISSVATFKELDSHNEKVTIEWRRGKLE